MTLVIAFVGNNGAVMAGDLREIVFSGGDEQVRSLEKELYSGVIVADSELVARARELGVEISIRDTKNKILHREGVLIGDVTSREGGLINRRRLYATTGAFAIVDFTVEGVSIRQMGTATRFVVLGSEIAKRVAAEGIAKYWKGGGVKEALETIMRIMSDAAERTATVSRPYVVIQTSIEGDIGKAMGADGVQEGIFAS